MSGAITGIQPQILQWARERAGYSVEEVAQRLKQQPESIRDWEAGRNAPTYPQLEKLAYTLYKRPIALFFLPQPPNEPEVQQEFRSLPNVDLEELDPQTRYLLRLAHAFQLSLQELNDGQNSDANKIFRDIRCPELDQVTEAAEQVRDYLGIDLESQLAWHSSDIALKAWRGVVEQVGVYVFKQSFKQKSISGFCIVDDEFPIIFLNNGTSKNRQIFTLFHELAHLLCGVNDISKVTGIDLAALSRKDRQLEQLCNALAGEILVPRYDLLNRVSSVESVHSGEIDQLAVNYCVSRDVIARRLLDCGVINSQDYAQYISHWDDQADSSQSQGVGGNYYATQATYLGDKYLQLVFSKYYQGRLNLEQVADYLGVKVKSVAGLEAIMQGKVATA